MAVTWRANEIAAPAGEDMRMAEFHAGRMNADGTFGIARNAATCLGVLRGDPAAGDTASIQHSDVIQACAGAAIDPAVNKYLMPNASGRFIPATTGSKSVVQALSGASGDGQLVTALVGREVIVP